MSNSFAHNKQEDEKPVITEYPVWMYGPGGESKIFEQGEAIPEGWEDHPSKVQEQNEDSAETTDQQEGKGSSDEEKAENEDSTGTPDEETVSEEELLQTLKEKSYPELQTIATELGIDKKASKADLIDKIASKLIEGQEDDNAEIL